MEQMASIGSCDSTCTLGFLLKLWNAITILSLVFHAVAQVMSANLKKLLSQIESQWSVWKEVAASLLTTRLNPISKMELLLPHFTKGYWKSSWHNTDSSQCLECYKYHMSNVSWSKSSVICQFKRPLPTQSHLTI